MKQKAVNSLNVLHYMECLIQKKERTGKEGTASCYRATKNRLTLFCGKQALSIGDINVRMVNHFVDHLLSRNLSSNSITNYLSMFRATYNQITSERSIVSKNPFLHLKLHPVSVHKRAVNMQIMMDIARLELKEKRLIFARNLFIFSFMACGMAFIDLAHLTRSNIINNTIVYHRIKTNTEIRISITPGMARLISLYASESSPFLFPILRDNASYADYKVALRTYNRRLQAIANKLSYPLKLTSYVARHSWAMHAKNSNVSVSIISDALGHTTEKTTQFYLSSLDQSILDKANKKVIDSLEKWVVKNVLQKDAYLYNKSHSVN